MAAGCLMLFIQCAVTCVRAWPICCTSAKDWVGSRTAGVRFSWSGFQLELALDMFFGRCVHHLSRPYTLSVLRN